MQYKPYLLVLIYSGVYPISYHQNGLRCSTHLYIYCFSVMIIVIATAFYTFYLDLTNDWQLVLSDLFYFTQQIEMIVIIITYVSANLIGLTRSETHTRLLNGLNDIAIDLKHYFQLDQIDQNFEKTLTLDVCMIIIYLFIEVVCAVVSPRHSWFAIVLTFCINLITMSFCLIIFHIKHCVLIWNNRFDIVCERLDREFKTVRKINICRIEQLMKFIETSAKLKEDLSSTFSFVLLMNSVLDFVIVTLSSYGLVIEVIYSAFNIPLFVDIIIFFGYILPYLVKYWIVARTMQSLSNRFDKLNAIVTSYAANFKETHTLVVLDACV